MDPRLAAPIDRIAAGPRGGQPVYLRQWTRADLPTIEAASRDPYIPLITTVPALYTPEAGEAWLARQGEHLERGRACPLAVTVRGAEGPDHVVGFAAVNRIDWAERTAAVGYWILAEERGRGYAGAALALLPGLAAGLDLRRLEALIERDNLASQATCRRVGFLPNPADERIGGQEREMLSFALTLQPNTGA